MVDITSGFTPQAVDTAQLASDLEKITEFEALKKAVVNKPFEQKLAVANMFLGIIVLLLVNKKTGMIDRVALSNTELAKNTTDVSYVPFDAIKIPLSHAENIIARTIDTGKPHDTTDWYYMFTPALTGEQARINQASGGIAYSAVYPLKFDNGGAMIFSYYQYEHEIGKVQEEFMKTYSGIVAAELTKKFPK